MKKIWVHKSKSFREANQFDLRYYLSMSASQRLETIQFLREIYLNLLGIRSREKVRKGFRRVIKVVQ